MMRESFNLGQARLRKPGRKQFRQPTAYPLSAYALGQFGPATYHRAQANNGLISGNLARRARSWPARNRAPGHRNPLWREFMLTRKQKTSRGQTFNPLRSCARYVFRG